MRRSVPNQTRSVDEATILLPSPPFEITRPTARAGTHRELLSKRRTDTIDSYLQAARQAFDAHEYAAAVEACEQAALFDPDEPRVLDLLQRATDELDRARIRGWLDDARLCMGRQDLEQALQLVARALQLDPGCADAQVLQGEIDMNWASSDGLRLTCTSLI